MLPLLVSLVLLFEPATVTAECPDIQVSNTTDLPSSYSRVAGTSVVVECSDGYAYDSAVYAVTCQPSGVWTPLPTCTDVDECLERCRFPTSECTNTVGSYECLCRSGYAGDAVSGQCEDINECNSTCATPNSVCRNYDGRYECTCEQGYFLNKATATCQDVNECLALCKSPTTVCVNTMGSFNCSCSNGYTGNALSGLCEDIGHQTSPAAFDPSHMYLHCDCACTDDMAYTAELSSINGTAHGDSTHPGAVAGAVIGALVGLVGLVSIHRVMTNRGLSTVIVVKLEDAEQKVMKRVESVRQKQAEAEIRRSVRRSVRSGRRHLTIPEMHDGPDSPAVARLNASRDTMSSDPELEAMDDANEIKGSMTGDILLLDQGQGLASENNGAAFANVDPAEALALVCNDTTVAKLDSEEAHAFGGNDLTIRKDPSQSIVYHDSMEHKEDGQKLKKVLTSKPSHTFSVMSDDMISNESSDDAVVADLLCSVDILDVDLPNPPTDSACAASEE